MALLRTRNKNAHYKLYLWTNHRRSRVLQEIGVKEVDGDVKFQTGSRNMAVLRMRDEK